MNVRLARADGGRVGGFRWMSRDNFEEECILHLQCHTLEKNTSTEDGSSGGTFQWGTVRARAEALIIFVHLSSLGAPCRLF